MTADSLIGAIIQQQHHAATLTARLPGQGHQAISDIRFLIARGDCDERNAFSEYARRVATDE